MKTRSEKKYVDLIISMIMNSGKSNAEKEIAVKKFFNDHSYYYENFCYNVYYLTLLQGNNVLTVDDTGLSYINLKNKDSKRKYYDVLVLNDFSPCCSDVIMHIDVALNHLYELIHAEQPC